MVAGLASGLAVFAYPSLVVAVVAAFPSGSRSTPSAWRREVVGFGVPAFAVFAVAMGSVLGSAGLHAVSNGYHRSSDYLGHTGSVGQARRRLRPPVDDAALPVPRPPRARAAPARLALPAAARGAAAAGPAAARAAGVRRERARLVHVSARVRRALRRARRCRCSPRLGTAQRRGTCSPRSGSRRCWPGSRRRGRATTAA